MVATLFLPINFTDRFLDEDTEFEYLDSVTSWGGGRIKEVTKAIASARRLFEGNEYEYVRLADIDNLLEKVVDKDTKRKLDRDTAARERFMAYLNDEEISLRDFFNILGAWKDLSSNDQTFYEKKKERW
jgi:hypothetical protein